MSTTPLVSYVEDTSASQPTPQPVVVGRREYMPRYIVERTFPDRLGIPPSAEGARACRGILENNAAEQVHWVHSYVSADDRKTFDVYDAPSPEAIRRAARLSGLPVDAITRIRVLDPYFHFGAEP